jgi:exosortase
VTGGCHCAISPVSLILELPPMDTAPVSTLVQSELSTPRSSALPRLPVLGIPVWQGTVLILLILWLYASTLLHLVTQWWRDPNFSHGFFVPLFSVFLLWQEQDRLARIVPRPSWSGLAIVAAALCILLIGQMGAELFLARMSLLILVAGLIMLFAGWPFLRAVAFPLAFLLLMIPIPSILFNHITFPLQIQASKVSAFVLSICRVPTLLQGNVIELPSKQLEVAEACSGIRSLMSLITLSIIYGYLMEKRLWVRWVLAIASAPIAIAANSVRIIGTGLIVYYWNADKAEGFFHASWGWITFVVSLIMLYGLHALIRVILHEPLSRKPGAES